MRHFRFIIFIILSTFLTAALPLTAKGAEDNDRRLEGAIKLFENNEYNKSMSLLSEYIQEEEKKGLKADERGLTKAYYFFGGIYTFYSDYAQALEVYGKGYELSVKAGDNEMQFKFINNMIGNLCSMKNTAEASRLNEKIRHIKGISRGKLDYFYSFNKGYIAENRGDTRGMSEWMNRAIDIVDKSKLPQEMKAYPYSELYQYYEKRGNLDSALTTLLNYDSLARSRGLAYLYVDCCKGLMRIYTKIGDKEKALLYQDMYFRYTDSLLNVNEFAKVKDGYRSYRERLTKDEIDGLRKTNFYQTAAMLLLIAIVVGVLAALLFITRQKRTLKEAYQALYSRNKELLSIETHRETAPDTASCGEKKTSMDTTAHDMLLHRIENVMTDESVFCDPEFTQSMLAKIVGSNTNYVSQIINNTYGKNFRTFVSEYRIKTAMKRLMDTECFGNYSIQGISESVGYKSTSNFIASFKRMTGMTPSLYQKMSRESLS